MVNTLVSIRFGGPLLGHTIKTNCIKRQTVDPEICSILTSLGLVSPPHLVYEFSRKNFLMLY